ncbi:hypothetical protein DCAR_0729807 [Daucus carota subsp. sativus]|uniref:RING-type E3 ubiquitin transferase n=1 Tax=Daucus carota subsp. sativus TaxID=79200 RepID=A0AAF1B8P1_DAUCS|nr:hypothetical protein DCAR_0729807 [Daucus carota subsp. sativus]
MVRDVAYVTDQALPPPSTRAVKVHSRMCTELMKLVSIGAKLLPQIEEARPGGSAGMQALVLLSNTIEKAKLIIEDCCHSSKLYMAITGDAILSRCEKARNSYIQSLSQIQYVVPVKLSSEISHIISDLSGVTFVLDPSEEEAGKILKYSLQQFSSATYSIEESTIQSVQRAASRLHITSQKAIIIEKRSIRKLLDNVGDGAPPKRRILIFLLNYLKKYQSITRENLDNASTEHENSNVLASSHEQYIEVESHTTCPPAEAQVDILSRATPPEEFRCPLSCRMMYDPVVIDSGETFERMFIQKWFSEGHDTCPKTKRKLSHLSLTPNVRMKSVISRWCTAYGVSILDPLKQSEAIHLQDNSLNSVASLSNSMCNLSLPTDFSSVSMGYSDSSLNSESSFENMPERGDSVFLKRSGDSKTTTRNARNHTRDREHLQKLDTLPWESQCKMIDDYKIHLKNDNETIQFASEENFVDPLVNFLEKALDLNDVKAMRAGCLLMLAFVTKSSGGQYLNERVYILLASVFHLEVAIEAVCIVEVLSHYQYCRTKIAASGVISSIIRVLEAQNRELSEAAIRILYNLSFDNEIQAYIVATDFIRRLVHYFEDSSLEKYCIAILKNLCNHEAVRVSVAETHGCIASIARMLETDSRENQEHAVYVLLSLCSQRDVYCQLVMDEGVIPALVSISVNGNDKGMASAMELLRLFREKTDTDDKQDCPESDMNTLSDSSDDIIEHKPSPKSRGFFKKIMFKNR